MTLDYLIELLKMVLKITPICETCRMSVSEHDRPMLGHPEQKRGCRGWYFGTVREKTK